MPTINKPNGASWRFASYLSGVGCATVFIRAVIDSKDTLNI